VSRSRCRRPRRPYRDPGRTQQDLPHLQSPYAERDERTANRQTLFPARLLDRRNALIQAPITAQEASTVNVRAALKGQYHGALAMLKQAVERCPDHLWLSGEHPRTVWRVAYHTLFYTDLYMQSGEGDFQPWHRHREESNSLAELPWPPHDMPKVCEPYTKDEVLQYLAIVDGKVDETVDRLDLDAPDCGFWWYDMPKLDHQIMNIRHIQQHAGQLSELEYAAGVDLDWVGRSKQS